MSDEQKAEQKVVLITGAGRGIGYGIAECFAAQNAKLVIADIDRTAAEAAATKLAETHQIEAISVACDVTQREQVEAMVQQAIDQFGRLDVLVNNAGICPFVDAMEMTPDTFAKTVDINLAGPFHCTQVAAQHMIERGEGGDIIFITSLNENFTNAKQVDYASSKGGLRMQMKAFCLALGQHGIRCNAVAPGIMLTDMTAFHWEKPENASYIKQRVPVGRIGLSDDIGAVCVFLTSQAAGYINGTTITVDGGYTASC